MRGVADYAVVYDITSDSEWGSVDRTFRPQASVIFQTEKLKRVEMPESNG